MSEGFSIADAAALARNNDCCNDNNWGNGGFMWVFFLFFLLAWGGNGWGFNRNNENGNLTRAELCESFNFNDLQRQLLGVQNGLCDGFYAMNTTMLQGFNGVQRDLCNGFNGVNNNITQLGYQMKDCCCETNRNIDAVRYENAQNTCQIMQNNDRNTQRIIDTMTQNTIQALRDKLEDRDRDVMTRDFQLSQQAQNAYLVNQLRPCPIPAYPVCSPYESYFNNNRGCGYNYNNNCGC